MPQVDDEYRKRAAMARFKQISRNLPVDPSGAAGMGSVAGKSVAAATAAALKSKPLQSALQAVENAGTKRMSDFIGKDVNGLTQADLPRYGMAAKGKLVDFLNENLASGELTVQQANRLVKAIPYHYIGDVSGIGISFH